MIVILTGILVTSLGLIGCIGAVSERGIFLRSYVMCLSIAIAGQILMGSFVLLRKDTVNAYTRDVWMAAAGPNVQKVYQVQNAVYKSYFITSEQGNSRLAMQLAQMLWIHENN